MDMQLVVDHNVGIPKARKAAEEAFRTYSEKYPNVAPSLAWKPGQNVAVVSLTAPMGAGRLTGTATIEERRVVYDMDVPPSLKFFMPLITGTLEKETREWLAKG